ncbi:MAG: hypothetical protein U5R30_01015 [Deltaproteobacteria bacterium]|nr:hypothetical protein [Deltaproteobacteria bacterium]
MSPATLRILLDYNWPGNVRELENAIEHAFVVCNREQIEPYDLPVEIRQVRYPRLNKEETNRSVLRPYRRVKITKEELLGILNESDWKKAEAGRRIGIKPHGSLEIHEKISVFLSKGRVGSFRETRPA